MVGMDYEMQIVLLHEEGTLRCATQQSVYRA
jgi:hypothetical protein